MQVRTNKGGRVVTVTKPELVALEKAVAVCRDIGDLAKDPLGHEAAVKLDALLAQYTPLSKAESTEKAANQTPSTKE